MLEKMRNITTSGKTLPTIVLIIVPSITIVMATYMVLHSQLTQLTQSTYKDASVVGSIPFYVVVVYIFYPSGRKYFKKGEYQKGIDEFEYIKQILLVEIPLLPFYCIFAVLLHVEN